jgi:hypothetical protein
MKSVTASYGNHPYGTSTPENWFMGYIEKSGFNMHEYG